MYIHCRVWSEKKLHFKKFTKIWSLILSFKTTDLHYCQRVKTNFFWNFLSQFFFSDFSPLLLLYYTFDWIFQADGLTDMTAMKQVIAKLETELHEKSTNVSHLEAEIRSLQRKCQVKDQEIAKQEREIHKLRVSFTIFFI